MYTLFANEPLTRGNGFTFPQFDYVRDVLLRSVDQWISYRRQNSSAMVASDHYLVKLLQTLNITYTGDLPRYRSTVEQRMAQFSGSFGMASSLFKGRAFQSPAPFYGNEAIEVIIASDEDFDLYNAETTWKSWEPVRVLAHHRSDLGIESLDGKSNSSERGLAVISINIPMLACQFQLFRQEQRDLDLDFKQTIMQFVLMYPLTNAIYSHLNVALFNRLSRLLMNEPIGQSFRRLPFAVPDLTSRTDQALEQVLSRLTTTKLTFADMLRNCPALSLSNQLEVHALPQIAHTYQVLWALTAARLNLVAFLLRLKRDSANERSVDDVTHIRRNLVQAESSKWLSNGLAPNVGDYFKFYLQRYIYPYL